MSDPGRVSPKLTHRLGWATVGATLIVLFRLGRLLDIAAGNSVSPLWSLVLAWCACVVALWVALWATTYSLEAKG